MRIVNFGSLNIDKTYRVPHMVREGETISSLSYQEFVGGKGLNQSIAIARAGGEVWHAGLVGESDGDSLVHALQDAGVHTDFVGRSPLPSGHTVIQINSQGNNSIIVSGGANRAIDPTYVDTVLAHFEEGDLILLQNEISCLHEVMEKAAERKLRIYLNPSPIDEDVLTAPLDQVHCFLINEIEGQALTGGSDSEEILALFKEKYPQATVVLTLGEKGAIYQDQDHRFFAPAEKIQPVDTTAAGDTFCGYFLAAITKGQTVEDAMSLASRAAAKTCLTRGASNAIPKLSDLA